MPPLAIYGALAIASLFGSKRCAGLGALALCGLLLAQPGQDASGQGRAGGAREGEVGGGQDKQMLVAHGLAMAIEGSTLQALAAE